MAASSEGEVDDRCRICQSIPYLKPGSGLNLNGKTHTLHLDLQESRFEKIGPGRFACSLERAVCDLYRLWTGTGPLSKDTYFYSCSYQQNHASGWNFVVCFDQDIWTRLTAYAHAVVLPDPFSVSTLRRIRTWLGICDTNHQGCLVVDPASMPTRVLDLGDPPSQVVTLVETRDKVERYVALSHCWGKGNTFLTTSDSIQKMMTVGFLPSEAPSTFSDAIRMTRELGIRYLWIDSLCIIQGDADDWEMEAARMGDVYRKAYLTIAASNSESDAEGFAMNRPTENGIVEAVHPSGSANLYLRPAGNYTTWEHLNYWKGSRRPLIADPLSVRGWTLQEFWLSPRILEFRRDRILWKCQGCTWDETIADIYEEDDQKGTETTIQRLVQERNLAPNGESGSWYALIEDYSSRLLTFQSDKFPALSGLAAGTASHTGLTYCAGMWWEDISDGLCWQESEATSERGPTSPPEVYIAPSWSWASSSRKITYKWGDMYLASGHLPAELLPSAKFHEFDVQYTGSNAYGQISGAWLRLSAVLAPLSPMDESDETNGDRFKVPAMEVGKHKDKIEIKFDAQTLPDSEELFLLYLKRAREYERLGKRGYTKVNWKPYHKVKLIGLIVSPVSETGTMAKYAANISNQKLWRRVGYFSLLTTGLRERHFWDQAATELVMI